MVTAPFSVLSPATCSLVAGTEVPMPTLSVEVVRKTDAPPSVQPVESVASEVLAIVNFLLVGSVSRLMPAPYTNVNISVFEPALISDWSATENVLKIFWELPGSELAI